MATSIKTKKTGPPQFADKEFDVSLATCCFLLYCPMTCGTSLCFVPFTNILHLGSEEVTMTQKSLCGNRERKMPYGELGHVGKSNCMCCVGVSSAIFGDVSPGCGCENELVDEIVEDLKERQSGRGDQGQVQRQEATMEQIEELNMKFDKIMEHLKIERE